jgi:hypothetical protein
MDATTQQQVQPGVYQQPVQPAQAQTYVQPTQMVAPVAVPATQTPSLLTDSQFWKGALIGAAVTLLVTNESVQKGAMKMISKAGAVAQSGVEEIKEKFEDAKAEAEAEMGK